MVFQAKHALKSQLLNMFIQTQIEENIMLAGFLTVWLIAFSTGMAINCDAKGYNPKQCGQSIRNVEVVHEDPNSN